MRLGREIQHGARPVRGKQLPDQFAIADVAMHEDMSGVARKRGKVFEIAGVGQEVEVDD